VLAYNIPGVTNLVLAREQIVGIYNGSINNWGDPTFAEHNPGLDLPNATIVPMGRCGSSSTETFTRALSSFSASWAAKYGVFEKKAGWNDCVVTRFTQRNSEMADIIRREPYHIGFMTPSSAVAVSLPYAAIVNRRGRVTVADRRSVQAAIDERSLNMSSRLTSNLVDCEHDDAYPIASFSYFIVRMTHKHNCSVAVELARYIEWFLTSSQAEAEIVKHFMVPVGPSVARRIRSTVLERMTCGGRRLMDLVRRQKYEEQESLETWKSPVQVVTPLIALITLLLIAYATRQRVKYLRVLNRDDWKINFFEIDFAVKKKRGREMGVDEDAAPSSSSEKYFGRLNVHDVVATPLSIAKVFNVDRKVKQALMRMREEIGHENVARFFGISSHNNAVYLVEKYCANGTLVDFLRDYRFSVNQSFRYMVCADIANGMAYLHRQNLIHGNLSIDKCCVDSRWTINIVDWEYVALYDVVRRLICNKAKDAREKTVLHYLCSQGSWSFRNLAPEIQNNGRLFEPTRAGDVFSFGIIIRDMFMKLPSQEQHRTSSAKLGDKMPTKARQIMKCACYEIAINRPTFEELEKSLRSAINGRQTNLLDRYEPPSLLVRTLLPTVDRIS